MNNLAAYTTLFEKIFLAGLLAGAIFGLLHVEPFDVTITVVSLFGLGIAYFLSAYKPIEMPDKEGGQSGMKALLASTIVPKVLWISSAVSVIAIALFVLNSDARGYQQMFFIGGVSIATALIIVIVLAVGGIQSIRSLLPVLLRAIPLLGADVYFLLR